MFICPVCQTPLTRTRNPNGVHWNCLQCNGMAATLPVLRGAIDRTAIAEVWRRATGQGNVGDRRCPSCLKSMLIAEVGANQMELDVCRRCQFIWFDAGEIEQMEPPPADGKKDQPDSEEAREALAHFQLERVNRKLEEKEDEAGGNPDEWWKWIPGFLGMPVEMRAGKVTVKPIATWTLSALTVLISLVCFNSLPGSIAHFGLTPGNGDQYLGLNYISYFFVHASITHLLGNIYFLMVFGDDVEEYLATPRFLLLIGLATICGAVLHGAFDPRENIPLVGASAGISGIIAYYALQFPRKRIGLFFWWAAFFRGIRGGGFIPWIGMPAWVALLLWIGYQLLLTVMQVRSLSNVSALAHIGGAAVGVICWYCWEKLPVKRAGVSVEGRYER